MRQLVVVLGFLWIGCSQVQVEPGKSVILPPSTAAEFHRQCSRSPPPRFEDTWQPSPEVVAEMESHFVRLQRLKSNLCCFPGARMGNVNRFARQYVGIVVEGRRLIYINGYRSNGPVKAQPLVGVCDGGDDYWGVLYDPEKRRFFDLAFNGFA